MFHPDKEQKVHISHKLLKVKAVFVAASDYVQISEDAIANGSPVICIHSEHFGFGRSESRASLRDFFEVDAKHIAYAALYSLYKRRINQD